MESIASSTICTQSAFDSRRDDEATHSFHLESVLDTSDTAVDDLPTGPGRRRRLSRCL